MSKNNLEEVKKNLLPGELKVFEVLLKVKKDLKFQEEDKK